MKIVYCTWSILGSGGLERVLAIKANYLADVLGHEITIITTFNGKGSPFHHFSSSIRFVDLGVEYKGDSFFGKLSNRIRQRRIMKKRLSETLMELRPDIAISLFQNEASILPSIKDGSVKIIENHSSRFYVLLRCRSFSEKLIALVKSYNRSRIVGRYDAMVTLTNEDKNDWPSNENIHIIPNPHTIDFNGKADFRGKRVIAVGRIAYEKGFDSLIRIWNIVEHRHPDWELEIIGAHDDIDCLNNIKDLIRRFGLKRVLLLPESKTIEKEYLQSNILVLTSHFEGLPLVLIEGMSAGLPLVAFNCKCGPSDIIKDGENGFLVKGRDIEVFADRICRLIEDRDLHARMSVKALEYSRLYGIDSIMAQWTSLFGKLTESKGNDNQASH